jgi:hypothetical protein
MRQYCIVMVSIIVLAGCNPFDAAKRAVPGSGQQGPPTTCLQVKLAWENPTDFPDGTPLTDLAGSKIYYGLMPGNYSTEVVINDPTATAYTVTNLTPGNTYYFAAKSFRATGAESALTPEVSTFFATCGLAAISLTDGSVEYSKPE